MEDTPDEGAVGSGQSEVLDLRPQVRAVGRRVRQLRSERDLTLEKLAQRTSLSPSFLSLVERGKSSLALTSLFTIARALDVDVADLLPQHRARSVGHPGCEVTHNFARDVPPVRVGERDYRFLSAGISGRMLEPLLVTIHPTIEGQPPYAHEGEEFAWVLSGSLVYIVEGVEYRLEPGSCIHVQSSLVHAVRNDSENDAVVVWVLSQPLVRESLGDLIHRPRNAGPATN